MQATGIKAHVDSRSGNAGRSKQTMRHDHTQNILILYNLPRENTARNGAGKYFESEFGVLEEVNAVAKALAHLNIPFRIAAVRSLEDLPGVLSASPELVVFNLVESFEQNHHAAYFVPAVCESFGKTCTGNDTTTQLLAQDKWRTNAILRTADLPTPPGVLVSPGDSIPEDRLPEGPFIVKPALCDASEGIDSDSVVECRGAALHHAVERIHCNLHQPALIEKLIGRRELNVSIAQHGKRVEVVGIAEIDFSAFAKDKPAIIDYAAKWLEDSFEFQNTPRILPAPLSSRLSKQVARMALAAWRILRCRDYARIDFRLDQRDRPFIMDVNPNPDISPNDGFAAALQAAGLSYASFIHTMIRNARGRLPPQSHPDQSRRSGRRRTEKCTIRRLQYADRDPLLALLKNTGFFRADELETAREVLDSSIAKGEHGHYQTFVAEANGEPAGWVSFGSTACTLGTYDIYWIAVAPTHQHAGVGSSLMAHAEQLIRQRNGRNIIIETSGRDVYTRSRAFYLKNGYREAARLMDFYAPNDDKIIYMKALVE